MGTNTGDMNTSDAKEIADNIKDTVKRVFLVPCTETKDPIIPISNPKKPRNIVNMIIKTPYPIASPFLYNNNESIIKINKGKKIAIRSVLGKTKDSVVLEFCFLLNKK